MEEINKFSASDLIKRSCYQMWYLNYKHESYMSYAIEKGIKFQKKVAQHIGECCEEQRSSLTKDNIVIFACHDIITPDYVMEVKSYDPNKTEGDWFFNSCCLQTAFYKSILESTNGDTYTPKFRLRDGYKMQYKKVNPEIPYHLQFGDKQFNITVNNKDKIIDYFVNKAIASLDKWDSRYWDMHHKHKEYNELKQYFNVEEIL
jgi:hypothetical protein